MGVFVERRDAVWVSTKALQQERAVMPRLSALSGIRSWVYGVRFSPGPSTTLRLSHFPCFCQGCKCKAACDYPGLAGVGATHRFRVNQVKAITKVELLGFMPKYMAFVLMLALACCLPALVGLRGLL